MSKRGSRKETIGSGQPACKAPKQIDPGISSQSSEPDMFCSDEDLLPSSGLSGLIQLSNTPRPPDSTPDPVLISSSPLPGIDCEKPHDLQSLIAEIQDYKDAAQTILQNEILKDAILTVLGKKISSEMKSTLKQSILIAEKHKDERNYLLKIDPLSLCREFETGCNDAFLVVTKERLQISTTTVETAKRFNQELQESFIQFLSLYLEILDTTYLQKC